MRIAIFSDNFYPELSGISDSIIRTAGALADRGHEIVFCAPRYARRDFAALGLPHVELEHRGVSVVRFSSLPYPTGTGQGRIVVPTGLRALRFLGNPPDVVHVHLPFGTGLEGVAAAKMLRRPLVGTNHTPMSEFVRYSPVRNEAFARRLLAYTVWFYGRCDFVSSPAAAIFEEMARFGFNAPHRVVSNPIDLDAFRPRAGRRALKKKFGLSGHVLLYAGRLAEEKRIDLTIASAAALRNEFPDLEVAIVGKGAAEVKLRALAASLGIAKAVKFFGFIPDHRTLSDLYNASDVFVIMSTAETQSIVAMQAFACGVPVIAARAWGLKEYVTERNGILVAPGDGGELTRRIRYLLARPEVARTLGKGGLRSVARMSTATVADTWERIYKDVAAHYNTKR